MSNTKKTPKYEIDKKNLPALIVMLIGVIILTVMIFTLDGRVKDRDAIIAELTADNAEYAALVEKMTAEVSSLAADLNAAKEAEAAAVATAFDANLALATANERIDAAEQALLGILDAISVNLADLAEELPEEVVEEVIDVEEVPAEEESAEEVPAEEVLAEEVPAEEESAEEVPADEIPAAE